MNKLLNSPEALAILAVIALSIWGSHLDFKTVKSKQIQGKPLAEIMHPTEPIKQTNQEWDKDFKSVIEPRK